jgi:transcriptional regulator with XRE-family HTH domain
MENRMRYKNNVGPQVRRRRYALGWSQSDFAAKLQIAGFDISRSGVSKIEARLSYVDDKALLYLAEVLKVPVQELFPPRTPGSRLYEFMEKLETTRF